jgi:hypothetical protein
MCGHIERNVSGMDEMRNVQIFLLGNVTGKGHFGDVNMKVDFKEIGCEGALDSSDSE